MYVGKKIEGQRQCNLCVAVNIIALRVYNSCAYIHVQHIIAFADNLYIAQLNSNPEYKEFVFLVLYCVQSSGCGNLRIVQVCTHTKIRCLCVYVDGMMAYIVSHLMWDEETFLSRKKTCQQKQRAFCL